MTIPLRRKEKEEGGKERRKYDEGSRKKDSVINLNYDYCYSLSFTKVALKYFSERRHAW